MAIDQETVLRLLLAHRAMVMGYVAFIVRDAHLVEDVFQEVALTVLKKGETLDQEENFPVWVRQIARYKALNTLQKQKRAPQPVDESILNLLEDTWAAEDQAPASLATQALLECIQKLSPRAQQLIRLRYVDCLSGKDLAERLAQPVNTVYVALSRVYRNLSACVKLRLLQEGVTHG
jgi:RNA polymerase sigma-70 factor (ECF subfamily)